MAAGIFNRAIFNNAIFNTGSVPPAPAGTDDQASNWQANYWPYRSKADIANLEMLERIKLGILPALAREEADQAVREAEEAQRELAAGNVTPESAIGVQMQARDNYDSVFKAAYKEAYIADAVAEAWRQDMKRANRRRKAAMLLLH